MLDDMKEIEEECKKNVYKGGRIIGGWDEGERNS